MDGSIAPYQNTTEGAEISFICNPGFIPAEDMTAMCAADGRWSPDPAGHRCTCKNTYLIVQHTVLKCTCIAVLGRKGALFHSFGTCKVSCYV